MSTSRDGLSKCETVVVAAIEAGAPLPDEAREIIVDFQAMIRRRSLADLKVWLARQVRLGRLVRQRHHQRQGGGQRGDLLVLVQWAN